MLRCLSSNNCDSFTVGTTTGTSESALQTPNISMRIQPCSAACAIWETCSSFPAKKTFLKSAHSTSFWESCSTPLLLKRLFYSSLKVVISTIETLLISSALCFCTLYNFSLDLNSAAAIAIFKSCVHFFLSAVK